jgi:hypothetical protein
LYAKIDPATRTLTFRPDNAFAEDIAWGPAQDAALGKYKENYKAKVTYEVGTPNRLTEILSLFKKDGSGKGSYQPRNEKLIAFLALHRDAVSAFPMSSSQDYEKTMDVIYAQAARDTERAMKDFGGA